MSTDRRMAAENSSSVTEFTLSGLRDQSRLQMPLFFLFLSFYVVTVVGNLGLIALIGLNSHLQIPMDIFLFNLSFIDFSYSTTITPKILIGFVLKKNIISYAECITQFFFSCFFVFSESYILSAMAYDRYMAICKPLLYKVIRSPQMCFFLLAGIYGMGVLGAVAHLRTILFVTFHADSLINMCDMIPLLELACNSSYIHLLVVFIVVTVDIGITIVTIFISYGFILSNILHISLSAGRSKKAFRTCSSHIIVVSLFFGSGAFIYFKPPSILLLDQGKVVAMFNPLIYSLKNKDVKIALKKTLSRNVFS
ncbi:LOW QUALITY PROTEIN: olfactory receptor 8B8-like [Dipodomys spectabilis]|uniref:LOW QUALITY PROTEIN: olfactory receptor 8B8-like n=1 Tax=Dipodomys spectabilis TaxID=105255 RepID=UPI001C535AE9|nr:LOW QUALITY PROTEIN: olfactory receptor 8B8-like [Dipodomys spectabilis]